jgi:hypothetical protein
VRRPASRITHTKRLGLVRTGGSCKHPAVPDHLRPVPDADASRGLASGPPDPGDGLDPDLTPRWVRGYLSRVRGTAPPQLTRSLRQAVAVLRGAVAGELVIVRPVPLTVAVSDPLAESAARLRRSTSGELTATVVLDALVEAGPRPGGPALAGHPGAAWGDALASQLKVHGVAAAALASYEARDAALVVYAPDREALAAVSAERWQLAVDLVAASATSLALVDRLASLRGEVADATVVHRAIGVLMATDGLDVADAFRQLVRRARGGKLRDVADAVLLELR